MRLASVEVKTLIPSRTIPPMGPPAMMNSYSSVVAAIWESSKLENEGDGLLSESRGKRVTYSLSIHFLK